MAPVFLLALFSALAPEVLPSLVAGRADPVSRRMRHRFLVPRYLVDEGWHFEVLGSLEAPFTHLRQRRRLGSGLRADPDLPVYSPRSMEEVVLGGLRERRLAAHLTASFALVALGLAVLGIYGITSYGVRRRTREMGIRMALGAERREILGLVVARGMKLTLIGIAIGLVSAFVASRFLRSLLFEVPTR